jgi:hypothetical protein
MNIGISNSGNEPLTVRLISLPSGEMRVDRSTPFTLSPRETSIMRVYLQPRREIDIGDNLVLVSDDPITLAKFIAIRTDIRALQMKSDLLVSTPELPLGEAATVVVTPFPQVHIEGGYIYHRSGDGLTEFPDSIPLSKYEDNYIAVIPGSFVTEAGLEYYFKIENSGVFATDPPGAPDSVFSRAVSSPQLITAAAQPNSGADFLEARDVKILVSLPLGAEFVQGTLHYRPGGEAAYQTSSFEADDPLPVALVADTLVGPRGLEYWVEVQTLTARLTDPSRSSDESPHSIRVTVPDLVEERSYPERAYRMVSVPLDFGSEFTGTLEALLSDQVAFGPYDPTQWRSFRYLPGSKGYAELSSKTKDDFKPVPGRAFWLISASKNRISTAPIKGLSTATDSAYALVLEPGWNMIGDPFDFPVAWDSILVDGERMADAESIMVEPPVGYVIKKGYRLGVETLEPFAGYWVKNLSDSNVVLRVPPKGASTTMMRADSTAIAVVKEPGTMDSGWRIEIRASCCDAVDCDNIVGVADGAAKTWDKHDRSEPPLAPGEAISLYFPHKSWQKHGDNYAVDVRGAYESLPASELKLVQAAGDLWGHIWRFDVAKSFSAEGVGDDVTLEFGGLESAPAEASIYLIDRDLDRLVDVRKENSYSFHSGERAAVSEAETRFVLIVGSKEFVNDNGELPEPPARTALHQNYPNPFNPSTIVRYDLARSCSVRLVIYDASGSLVRTLYEGRRQAGRYEEVWDGTNDDGRPVSTGIYFSHLETSSGFGQTRKLALIR